ncbi:MAG: hypothetical protein KAU48_10570, partial [Candidatus Thorarchaeota archaeon]|nr:hypothetical protein [Candidatus Thorarchaeota archaeon]
TPFLIQVFFSAAVSRDDALSILKQQEEQNRKMLELLQERTTKFIDEVLEDLPDRENEEFFKLTLELGIRHQETLLNWLEYAQKRVKQLKKKEDKK